MVTAGSDSSAATVEWMLAELMNHPEAMRKVRDEIDAVVAGGDRIVGEADLPGLPYLQAAFKETLRLHPAAPIAHRVSTGEVAVGGFAVPPRAAVFINVWAIGRDPAVWEDPPAFRPERFMPGGAAAAGLEPRGQHAQFMPFGGGRRGCPGVGLAQQSVPAALAALVQCFDWAVADGETGVVDMDESEVGLVCARKHPLLLRPTARLNPFPAVV